MRFLTCFDEIIAFSVLRQSSVINRVFLENKRKSDDSRNRLIFMLLIALFVFVFLCFLPLGTPNATLLELFPKRP